VLDLLFYAVPIIYFAEQVRDSPALAGGGGRLIYNLLLLNPMTVILVSYRAFLLPAQEIPLRPGFGASAVAGDARLLVNTGVPLPYFLLAFAVCVLAFVGGYAFFNARKWRFVEQL